jgi:hypothetical protein
MMRGRREKQSQRGHLTQWPFTGKECCSFTQAGRDTQVHQPPSEDFKMRQEWKLSLRNWLSLDLLL